MKKQKPESVQPDFKKLEKKLAEQSALLEIKNRELQIEAALENVRQRTMAMQSSKELSDAATVLFKQLRELGGDLWSSGFVLLDTIDHEGAFWMSNPKGEIQPPLFIPNTKDPATKNMYFQWKKGKKYYAEEIGGKELKSHYKYLLSLPKAGHVFQTILDAGISLPTWQQFHAVYFNYGYLLIITLEPTKEEALYKRFAKVFELTYTRFLDLKKVEEQARESQIEAALERIRSRSMGMQKSDELSELNTIILQQIKILNVSIFAAGIHICNEHENITETWIGDPSEGQMPKVFIDHSKDPLCDRMYSGWKQGNEFSIEIMKGEALEDHFKFMDTVIPNQIMFENLELPECLYYHLAYFSSGYFVFTTLDPCPGEHDIFKRFAKVFEQTYTRFLDLQKAEAQAREAQIEVALERVRARALAMHKSDELGEVANVLFLQVQTLGVPAWSAGFNILSEDKQSGYCSMSGKGQIQPSFHIPFTGEKSFRKWIEAIQRRDTFFIQELQGKDLEEHYQYLLSLPGFQETVDIVEEAGYSLPTYQINHLSFFRYGFLVFITYEKVPDAHEIFKRFTKVFEQTYTRFLDLQKAEEQAREAQIETALERVRGRAMALQQSDELRKVIAVIFEELTKLGIDFYDCNIIIVDEVEKELLTWGSELGDVQLLTETRVAYQAHPVLHKMYKDFKKGINYQTVKLSGKELKNYQNWLVTETEYKNAPAAYREAMLAPEQLFFSQVFMNHGLLEATGSEPLPENEADILKRFGKVIDLTYTRFDDLVQAEALAREAQIEAALERVRSRSMAMQQSTELNIILAKIFEELISLGIELERCVIWIYNQKEKSVVWWAANPEVESRSESFFISYQDHPVYHAYWKAWEERRSRWFYELSGDNMASWTDILFNDTELARLPEEVKIGMLAPEKVLLYNTFHDFGVLFAACVEPLSEDKISLLERFGKVFDQSYTRFKDIKQAEALAKEAVKQSSLDRVRAEIASMRSARDLQRITPIVWTELITLGVPFFRCGVFIIDENEQCIHAYLSTPQGKSLGVLLLSFDSSDTNRKLVEHWRKQKVYSDHWDKKQFKAWTRSMVEQGQIKTEHQFQAGEAPPESLSLQFIPFTQGMLYVGSSESLSESQIDLTKSLAEAFSIAYARYEDFKNLEEAKGHVENTLTDLKATQNQLIQSEKMASLGELTAGIAHEIQNPLNFVNNFSEVNAELVDELKAERSKLKEDRDEALEEEILNDIKENELKIKHHGRRAEAIVKGMLQHSRTSTGQKELTDINVLADEYLRLAYHGLRAKDKSFNSDFKTEFDEKLPKLNVIPQDIGRVLLNLINNAFYAVSSKALATEDGDYKPAVTVCTNTTKSSSGLSAGKAEDLGIEIRVIDNGSGIPKDIKDKIFQPFFTTKPTGEGTGLGLSLSYDIVKAHDGNLEVSSNKDEGATFSLLLPITENIKK